MRKSVVKKKFLLLLALVNILLVKSQDIEQMLSSDPLKIRGSVNLSSTAYAASGVENKREPFTWMATGNLGISLFGIDIPLTFSYSNRKAAYTQPFNRLSLSPSYRWIKTYIGHSSMTFSNYTLAGHQFLGGGVELTPGNWYFGAMYGQLKKATDFGPDTLPNPDGSFRRMGYGVKGGYNGQNSQLNLTVFNARDEWSPGMAVPDSTTIKPMENTVTSLGGRQKLFGRLSLEGEWARSMLTTDIRAAETPDRYTNEPFGLLMKTRGTTQGFNAFNAGITWEAEAFAIQARMEQVDAGYQSLGAYYCNNNFRNYTLIPSVNLWKGKLNLSANVGLQEDNLNKTDDYTSTRWVGSINANCTAIEKWNFNLTYSNFSNYTKAKPLQDPFYQDEFDSLSFYQISQNAAGSVAWQFGNQTTPQGLSLNLTYQRTGDHPAGNSVPVNTNIYTSNLAYTYAIPKTGTAIQTGLNAFLNQMPEYHQTTLGPMAGVSRSFLKTTLRTGIISSYNQVWQADSTLSQVLTANLNLSFNPKVKNEKLGKHTLSFNTGWVKRFPSSAAIKRSDELTVIAAYGYSF